MPATSKSQRRFMAMCEHDPQHAKGKCPTMAKAQMHDFAATPEKDLPFKKASGKAKKSR